MRFSLYWSLLNSSFYTKTRHFRAIFLTGHGHFGLNHQNGPKSGDFQKQRKTRMKIKPHIFTIFWPFSMYCLLKRILFQGRFSTKDQKSRTLVLKRGVGQNPCTLLLMCTTPLATQTRFVGFLREYQKFKMNSMGKRRIKLALFVYRLL